MLTCGARSLRSLQSSNAFPVRGPRAPRRSARYLLRCDVRGRLTGGGAARAAAAQKRAEGIVRFSVQSANRRGQRRRSLRRASARLGLRGEPAAAPAHARVPALSRTEERRVPRAGFRHVAAGISPVARRRPRPPRGAPPAAGGADPSGSPCDTDRGARSRVAPAVAQGAW